MSDDVRTFVAVLISADLKRTIGLVQEQFKKATSGVKWVAENNFHVTLKFLGNVSVARLGRIAEALSEPLGRVEPFEIEIGSVGGFPSIRRPRTVWVGITSGQNELAEVARRVDKGLEKLRFPREDRSFKSHITIGRLRDDQGAGDLGLALEKAEVGRLGSMRVESVAVMKSDLGREGPIYSVLSEIPLRRSEIGEGR